MWGVVIKWKIVTLELGQSFWTCFSTRYIMFFVFNMRYVYDMVMVCVYVFMCKVLIFVICRRMECSVIFYMGKLNLVFWGKNLKQNFGTGWILSLGEELNLELVSFWIDFFDKNRWICNSCSFPKDFFFICLQLYKSS